MILSFRPKVKSSASIILRGANDFMLDEMERSLHDSLCAVKRVMESKTVVAGGGAVEAALSIYLENFATSLVSFRRMISVELFHTAKCYDYKDEHTSFHFLVNAIVYI